MKKETHVELANVAKHAFHEWVKAMSGIYRPDGSTDLNAIPAAIEAWWTLAWAIVELLKHAIKEWIAKTKGVAQESISNDEIMSLLTAN